MAETHKSRSKKAGMPPGSLVLIGDQKVAQVEITLFHYNHKGQCTEKILTDVQEVASFIKPDTVTWLNVSGIHQIELLRQIGDVFQIHLLILEDILNTDQRPKVDDQEQHLFIVIKMLEFLYNKQDQVIEDSLQIEQMSMILGENYLITFQERPGDTFDPMRERIRNGRNRLKSSSADHLAYSLLDAVVDDYFIVLEEVGERIEALEDEILAQPSRQVLQRIYALKRELIFLRKAVWPLREVVSHLYKGDSVFIKPATMVYFRDVYDHTIQIIDTIETYRDMLNGLMDIYLSTLSHRMNEVMKVLTIIATIFIPLTFIVGIYGMNFEYMPELSWPWGYPAVMILMALLGIGMLFYFKHKRWL